MRTMVDVLTLSATPIPRVPEGLQLRQLPQPETHDVGLDQLVLGWFHRCLHPPMRNGSYQRLRLLQTLNSEPNYFCGY